MADGKLKAHCMFSLVKYIFELSHSTESRCLRDTHTSTERSQIHVNAENVGCKVFTNAKRRLFNLKMAKGFESVFWTLVCRTAALETFTHSFREESTIVTSKWMRGPSLERSPCQTPFRPHPVLPLLRRAGNLGLTPPLGARFPTHVWRQNRNPGPAELRGYVMKPNWRSSSHFW